MLTLRYFSFLLLFLIVACGEDDESPLPPEEPMLEIDDSVLIELPSDTGAVGFIVDGRQVLATGRPLGDIQVTFNDTRFANLSTRLPAIEQLGGLTFQWPRSAFTPEELFQLREGTSITVQLLAEDGTEIARLDNATQIVDAAGRLLTPAASLPRRIPSATNFSEDIVYLLQSRSSGKVVQVDPTRDALAARMRNYDPSKLIQRFRLVSTGLPGVYNLAGLINGRTVYITAFSGPDQRTAISWEHFDDPPTSNNYRFVLEPRSDGFFHLRSSGTGRLLFDNGDRPGAGATDPNDQETQWRLVAADLIWSVDDLGTTLSAPILPSAQTEFAFKQRIRNCANATTQTTIGVSRTRTQTVTLSREETISLFSSRQASWDVRASLTVGGSFYGVNVATTVESGYGQTTESSLTETTTEGLSETTSESTQVSTERVITVGPFASIIAYDAVQFYDDIKA
ncbi:MAG: hypothetical protein AAGA31_12515, partial [Bacteroidota bacterium]